MFLGGLEGLLGGLLAGAPPFVGGPEVGPPRVAGIGIVPSDFEGKIEQRGNMFFLVDNNDVSHRLRLCPRNIRQQTGGELNDQVLNQQLMNESNSEFESIVTGLLNRRDRSICVIRVRSALSAVPGAMEGQQVAEAPEAPPVERTGGNPANAGNGAPVPPEAVAVSMALAARGVALTPQQVMQVLTVSSGLSRQLAAQGISLSTPQVFQFLVQRMQMQRLGLPLGML